MAKKYYSRIDKIYESWETIWTIDAGKPISVGFYEGELYIDLRELSTAATPSNGSSYRDWISKFSQYPQGFTDIELTTIIGKPKNRRFIELRESMRAYIGRDSLYFRVILFEVYDALFKRLSDKEYFKGFTKKKEMKIRKYYAAIIFNFTHFLPWGNINHPKDFK